MDKFSDIQSFSGWEADTPYRWPANSYYQWENISLRKDLSWVELSSSLTNIWWSIDWDIIAQANLQTLWVNNGGIVICTDTGKVYLDWVLKTTFNTSTAAHDRVVWIWVNTHNNGTQYVYYITQTSFWNGQIHRSTTDLDTFNTWYREFSVSSGTIDYVGLIRDGSDLYIAVKNKVLVLDNLEIVTDYLLLPDEETIMFFSQFLGNYRIYTNLEYTWVQYLWDGIDSLPYARQEWINQPILWGTNDGATDYLVLWYNESFSDLYRVDGTQKTELRVNLESNAWARILWGKLSIREWIVYISGWRTGESDTEGIYTYGNYFPWTAQSLVQEFSAPVWESILYHSHSVNFSYFSCTDWNVYRIDHKNKPTTLWYASSGYIVSLMYEAWVWEDLNMIRFKLAFELNGWQIDIYARTALWETFQLIKSVESSDYNTLWKVDVDYNEMKRNWANFWEFNEIQFKMVLTRGSTQNSPKIKRFTAFFTTVNDQ